MEMPQESGRAWKALQREERLRRKIRQEPTEPTLREAGEGPVSRPPELLQQLLDTLYQGRRDIESVVANWLFIAEDAEHLDELLGELLRDRKYIRRRAKVLALLAELSPSIAGADLDEEFSSPPALVAGAGPNGAEFLGVIVRLMNAIETAVRECAATACSIEDLKARAGFAQRMKDDPVWFLKEQSIPVAVKQAWYAGLSLDVWAFAIGAASGRDVQDWLRTAILQHWYQNARSFLSYLAADPGVTQPGLLGDGDRVNLMKVHADYEQAERGYCSSLAQAIALGADTWPLKAPDGE